MNTCISIGSGNKIYENGKEVYVPEKIPGVKIVDLSGNEVNKLRIVTTDRKNGAVKTTISGQGMDNIEVIQRPINKVSSSSESSDDESSDLSASGNNSGFPFSSSSPFGNNFPFGNSSPFGKNFPFGNSSSSFVDNTNTTNKKAIATEERATTSSRAGNNRAEKTTTPPKFNITFGKPSTDIKQNLGTASKFNVNFGESFGGNIYLANGSTINIKR
jgi:hypothetical protein